MSLSINLILDDEQRSGGKINPKSTMRILAVSAPLLLLVIFFQQGLRYFILQTNLNMQESRWEAAEPRQNYANRQLARLNQNMRIATELKAWRTASPAWDAVLLAIMQSTPSNIQISTLRMQAVPAPGQAAGGSPPTRRPSILIEGRVSEPDAMQAIEALRSAMTAHSLLQETIQSAEVVNFAADPTAPGSPKRVFSIRIQLKDLPLENSR